MEYYDDIKESAGDVFLQTLSEVGIISESKAKILSSKSSIILENRQNSTPSVYVFNHKGSDFSVTWSDFWSVYSDLRNYKSYKDMLIALGVPKEVIADAYNKWDSDKVKGMIQHFGKTYGKQHLIPRSLDRSSSGEPGRNDFSKLGYINLSDVPTTVVGGKLELDLDAIAEFSGIDSVDEFVSGIRVENPDKDSIQFGSRSRDTSRTGRTIEAINKQELFPGEFYSNMSRIPRSSLFGWLRLWKKDTVGLKAERKDKWNLGLGRKWKKIFIMGYQVDKSFLYEIWFNTIDSTYSLHDHRGGELSKRVASMAEVMRFLYLQLAKTSPRDVDFLQNPFDRTTLDSFVRSMSTDLDQRTSDLMAREKAESEKIIKAIEKKEKEKEAFKKKVGQIRQTFNQASDTVFEPYKMTPMDDSEIVIGSDVKKFKKDTLATYQQRIDIAHKNLKSKKQLTAEVIDEAKKVATELRDNIIAVIQDALNSKKISKADKEEIKREIDRRNEKYARVLKMYTQELSRGMYAKQVNENFEEEPFSDIVKARMMAEEFASEVNEFTTGTSYNNRVNTIRNQADKESVNFKRLQDMLMATVVKYTDESRIGRYGTTFLDKMMNASRKDKVVYPSDRPSLFNRIKNFVRGTRYRADFICGYSLADRVDFEIWYITEPNPNYDERTDNVKLISSFYVYDLSSAKLIRKFIPYYRNAEQMILQKIGTIGR